MIGFKKDLLTNTINFNKLHVEFSKLFQKSQSLMKHKHTYNQNTLRVLAGMSRHFLTQQKILIVW